MNAFLLQQQFYFKFVLMITINPSDLINRNQNLPSWKLWSLEAFTSFCWWKETSFWYTVIKLSWEDFWDSQDLCIVGHYLRPSHYSCQLFRFFCRWVFFSNTQGARVITTLSFYQPPKLFSFRVFHHGMKESDLLIYVLHLRSSYATLLMSLWRSWKVCTSEPQRYTDRTSKP